MLLKLIKIDYLILFIGNIDAFKTTLINNKSLGAVFSNHNWKMYAVVQLIHQISELLYAKRSVESDCLLDN